MATRKLTRCAHCVGALITLLLFSSLANAQLPGYVLPASTVVGNAQTAAGPQTAINPLAVANLQSAVISVYAIATTNVASLSGSQTIDGVVVPVGQVVLLQSQTSATARGLWLVNTGAWTRPINFPSGYLIPAGCNMSVIPTHGTSNIGAVYSLTTAVTGSVTIDTTAQTWLQQFGTIATPTVQGTTLKTDNVTLHAAMAYDQVIVPALGDCLGVTSVTGGVAFGVQSDVSGNVVGNCIEADTNGHPALQGNGNQPAVTGTGCSASADIQDNHGSVTATGIDTCTVTFGGTFSNGPPHCAVVGIGSTVLPALSAAPTAAHAIFTTAAAGTFQYVCMGP